MKNEDERLICLMKELANKHNVPFTYELFDFLYELHRIKAITDEEYEMFNNIFK